MSKIKVLAVLGTRSEQKSRFLSMLREQKELRDVHFTSSEDVDPNISDRVVIDVPTEDYYPLIFREKPTEIKILYWRGRFPEFVVKDAIEFFRGEDEINHPQHYGGDTVYETIKVLRAWLTPEEFRGFLRGNAIKYQSRLGKKDEAKEDAAKAAWYIAELQKFLAEETADA
jgi:hypothetical protein